MEHNGRNANTLGLMIFLGYKQLNTVLLWPLLFVKASESTPHVVNSKKPPLLKLKFIWTHLVNVVNTTPFEGTIWFSSKCHSKAEGIPGTWQLGFMCIYAYREFKARIHTSFNNNRIFSLAAFFRFALQGNHYRCWCWGSFDNIYHKKMARTVVTAPNVLIVTPLISSTEFIFLSSFKMFEKILQTAIMLFQHSLHIYVQWDCTIWTCCVTFAAWMRFTYDNPQSIKCLNKEYCGKRLREECRNVSCSFYKFLVITNSKWQRNPNSFTTHSF